MSKKKMTLSEVLEPVKYKVYKEQVAYVNKLIAQGQLEPMKSAISNGKVPPLATKYWSIREDPDYSSYEKELLYLYSPDFSLSYYRAHIETYVKEHEDLMALLHFFKYHKDALKIAISINERSYQIFHKEKYLKSSAGQKVLAHCGLSLNDLNVTQTAEPFAYFAKTRKHPQNLLIIENKDPFCGMREHLLNGHKDILGKQIDTLIYGAGKRILSSLKDFDVASEPYMRDVNNTYYYYGDLDYEGIAIYESFARGFSYPIKPFLNAYQKMLEEGIEDLPISKEAQNKNISSRFFSYFTSEEVTKIKNILNSGRYVPQEYLTIENYEEGTC